MWHTFLLTSHRRWLPIAASTWLCTSVLSGCSAEGEAKANKSPAEAAPVVTAQVATRDYAIPIEVLGTARARESVLVTSRVSGRVSQIFFKEGATVQRGEQLVRLEDDAERAELRSATASADQAHARHQRLVELSDKGLVPRDELERQRQLLDEALARLELARVMLDQRTIRAPFSGSLGFREVSPGTLVQPGAAIVALDAIDTMRVVFSIAETLLAQIDVGGSIQAHTAAWRGQTFDGRIETIGTRVDEVTRAVPVQAQIDNSRRLLKPGMMVTLTIRPNARAMRYVPEAALAPENAKQFVWRVQPDASVEKVAVEVGVRAAGWVEIVSGVEVGDRVVYEGVANLRPGRTVREVSRPGMVAPGGDDPG